ncbi:hypothetical protein BDZ45DRAFT_741410 [Acephala macrosclerotiorum]|nr:hypothetical protein BDZ45DRAFT_741410 [Acephala macrosclerotiorum]
MARFFYFFPFLPTELPAKVWALILPQPRVLSLVFNASGDSVKVYSEYYRCMVYEGAWMIESEPILDLPLLRLEEEMWDAFEKYDIEARVPYVEAVEIDLSNSRKKMRDWELPDLDYRGYKVARS